MKVMHLIACGGIGGIERLMCDYSNYSRHDNVFVYGWEEGITAESIRAHGKKVYCLRGHEVGNIKTLARLNDLYKKESPEAIVVHNGTLLLLGGILLSIKDKKLKVYQYMHYSPQHTKWYHKNPKENIQHLISWCALHHALGVIAISDYVKQCTIECFHLLPEKIEVIYNGTDLSRFQILDDGKFEKGHRIIYTGRLIEGKGVQIVLQALAILNREFHFDVIGDGDYKENLVQLADELGLQENVTFHGSQRNVQDFLSESGIFVHTPILEEGFGITVVEAMAAGLICICSRSGGIPEIIKNRENGYLVEKNDPKALADTLEYVIDSFEDGEMKAVRTAAKQTAKKFSIQEYSSALDQTVSVKRGGGKHHLHQ